MVYFRGWRGELGVCVCVCVCVCEGGGGVIKSLSESIVRTSCRFNEVDVIKACHFLALQRILALIICKNGELTLVIWEKWTYGNKYINNKNFDFLDLFLKNSVSRRKFITHSQLCFTNCIITKLYFTHYSCVIIQVCILYPSFGKLVFCIFVLFAFYFLFCVEFNVIFLNFIALVHYELHNNCLHGGMCLELFVFVLTLGTWGRN